MSYSVIATLRVSNPLKQPHRSHRMENSVNGWGSVDYQTMNPLLSSCQEQPLTLSDIAPPPDQLRLISEASTILDELENESVLESIYAKLPSNDALLFMFEVNSGSKVHQQNRRSMYPNVSYIRSQLCQTRLFWWTHKVDGNSEEIVKSRVKAEDLFTSFEDRGVGIRKAMTFRYAWGWKLDSLLYTDIATREVVKGRKNELQRSICLHRGDLFGSVLIEIRWQSGNNLESYISLSGCSIEWFWFSGKSIVNDWAEDSQVLRSICMLQHNVSAFSSNLPAFYPAKNCKGRTQYIGKET